MDGIDLSSIAIDIARQEAASRNLDIHYSVGDVCTNPRLDKTYDLIVDSFCLQSIVTDADRSNLFRFVREHLKPDGYYLIITAGYREDRDYEDSLYDADSGIVYARLEETPVHYEDAIQFDDQWYLPNRRHCKRADLVGELADAGFRKVWQTRDMHGNIGLICKQAAVMI